MPMYDFSCPNNHRFEAIVPNSDTETVPCKHCQETATKVNEVPLVGWRNPDYGIQR